MLDLLTANAGLPQADPANRVRSASWPRRWDYQSFPAARGDMLAYITKCAERRPIMLAALRSRHETEGRRAAGRLSRRYLRSLSSNVAAMAQAYGRKVGDLAEAPAQDIADLLEIAAGMSAWHGTDQRSIAIPKDRKTGSPRYVFASRMKGYGLERLALDVARALGEIAPTQFISQGGRPRFEEWLAAEMPSARLVITTDIPSCYETIRRSSVETGFPLPRKVTKAVLFDPKDHAVFLTHAPKGLVPMSNNRIAEVSSPGRGIPQGSACATLAAETVMARVIHAVSQIGPGIRAASYGDNLLFLLDDPSKQQSVISVLTTVVGENFDPAVLGELTRRIQCVRPSQGIFFCGRIYRMKKGILRSELPGDLVANFGALVHVDIEEARLHKDLLGLDKLRHRIEGWLANNMHFKRARDEAVEALAILLNAENSVRKYLDHAVTRDTP